MVEDYAAEGRSLARVDGKVVFIENTVPGDVVDVKLFKNKKDWAEGYPLAFHKYSKDRVEPFCSHFGVCGGCQWQMLPYAQQLAYKQKQVEETLKRIGKAELPELLPIIGARDTMFYRNKLEYTFSNREFLPPDEFRLAEQARNADAPGTSHDEPNNVAVAGFHAKGVYDKVIDIETCFLQAEPSNAIRRAVKDFAQAQGYSFYDIKHHKGLLRGMQVRMCTTGQIMVNLIFGYDDPQKIKSLLEIVLNEFPEVTTLLYTINSKWNDSLSDLVPIVHFGKGFIVEKMSADSEGFDFQFKIGPTSFFQTNTAQAGQLYNVVRHFAELTGTETVYDLYCGTGSIGIFLGREACKIVGVELIDAAIIDARENAAMNHIDSAHFITGDVAKICNDEFFGQYGKPDVIISDPPRAGMHPDLVYAILNAGAPIVVYVSCNPATQARDINLLAERYSVTKVQPVDMFPQTHHIENVVQLKMK